ncbi:MAG: hypothetical protein LBQ39_05320 [Tannerellaceae bacterium]|nr:hypothetical protein [Tannerellaceae bacterium]
MSSIEETSALSCKTKQETLPFSSAISSSFLGNKSLVPPDTLIVRQPEDDRSPIGGRLTASWRTVDRQLANDHYLPSKPVVAPYQKDR